MGQVPPEHADHPLHGMVFGFRFFFGAVLCGCFGVLMSVVVASPVQGHPLLQHGLAVSRFLLPCVVVSTTGVLSHLARTAERESTLWAIHSCSLLSPCTVFISDRAWRTDFIMALALMLATNCCLTAMVLYLKTSQVFEKRKKVGKLLIQLQKQLRRESSLREQAVSSSQAAIAEAIEARNSLSSILAHLCDFVLHIDDGLCLEKPSQAVCNLLRGSQHAGFDLDGSSLLKFMASDEDIHLLKESLAVGPSGAGVGDREGAAACVSVDMKDADGHIFPTEVFHTTIGGASLERMHILVLRLSQAWRPLEATRHVIWGGAGASASVHDEAPCPLLAACRGGSEVAMSITSATQYSVAGARSSRIAFPFDAGNDFRLLGQHWLFDSQARASRNIAQWVIPKQRVAFERWVIREVQAAPWDGVEHSSFFPESLSLALPGGAQRMIMVESAWLEIGRPEGSTLPVTLWLAGLSPQTQWVPFQGGQLPFQDHVHSSATSSIVADDSVSVGGGRARSIA